jgi:streptogramin lyase
MSKVTGRGRGSAMGRHQLAMPVLVAVLVAGAIACNAPSSSPSPSSETVTANLVTEEVEPGVERIRSDGAGHDLEERHPNFRYDMDDVYVTPDGTVWLSSTYRDTDNEANPPGGLVWALGQSETSQYPAAVFCFRGAPDQPQALGVTCIETATDTQTRYLAGTQINAVAPAPDGTFWAVGSDGSENGGLYHITPP